MYVYSFGAPGHGRGVFDGVGGAIKNKVHSLIKATKTVKSKINSIKPIRQTRLRQTVMSTVISTLTQSL